MTPEELFAQWGHEAVFTLDQSDLETQHPVVAVFDRPHGYVIVFPGYDDPYGAATPKAHHIRGNTTQPAADTLVTRDDAGGRTCYLQAVADHHEAHLTAALGEWRDNVAEKGKTEKDEREWLRRQVQGLGYPMEE